MKDAEDEAFDELARKQGMWGGGFQSKRAAAADKQELAQEPVAWPCLIAEADFSQDTVTLTMQCDDYKVSAFKHWLSPYPPKREWVGLTDAEIEAIYLQHHNQWCECESPNWGYERAIEQALKEKNNGT
jgi:hypothetical protein